MFNSCHPPSPLLYQLGGQEVRRESYTKSEVLEAAMHYFNLDRNWDGRLNAMTKRRREAMEEDALLEASQGRSMKC